LHKLEAFFRLYRSLVNCSENEDIGSLACRFAKANSEHITHVNLKASFPKFVGGAFQYISLSLMVKDDWESNTSWLSVKQY
jgi:hypothetical protein